MDGVAKVMVVRDGECEQKQHQLTNREQKGATKDV